MATMTVFLAGLAIGTVVGVIVTRMIDYTTSRG